MVSMRCAMVSTVVPSNSERIVSCEGVRGDSRPRQRRAAYSVVIVSCLTDQPVRDGGVSERMMGPCWLFTSLALNRLHNPFDIG